MCQRSFCCCLTNAARFVVPEKGLPEKGFETRNIREKIAECCDNQKLRNYRNFYSLHCDISERVGKSQGQRERKKWKVRERMKSKPDESP